MTTGWPPIQKNGAYHLRIERELKSSGDARGYKLVRVEQRERMAQSDG